MKIKVFVALVALLSLTANAQPYVELAYTTTKVEISENSNKLAGKPETLRLIMGMELSKNLSVEGLFATGARKDELTLNGASLQAPFTGAKLGVKSVYGVYMKSSVDFSPQWSGFVRLGMARAEGELTSSQFQTASAKKSGFSYGIGVSYAVSPVMSVNMDYMSYIDKDETKASGVSVGAGYKF